MNPRTVGIVLVMLAVLAVFEDAMCQSHRQAPTAFLGVTVNAGNRYFGINSSIPSLDRLKVTEVGTTLGLNAGTEAITGRVSFGSFRSSRLVRERITLVERKVGVDLSLLRIAGVKSKLLKPYVHTNFDFSTLMFYGNYQLPPPMPPSNHMACPDAPPPAEPTPVEPKAPMQQSEKDGLLGKMNVTRFNFGAGINVHIPRGRYFANMFAEVSSGMVLGTKAFMIEFKETKFSKQVSVNIGLALGLRSLH